MTLPDQTNIDLVKRALEVLQRMRSYNVSPDFHLPFISLVEECSK